MEPKNILFSSIFDFTPLYHGLGQSLERAGHRIYWITTSRTWHNWLVGERVSSKSILRLIYSESEFTTEEEKNVLRPAILACEACADLSLNQMLLMDRFVLRRQSRHINEYVYLYYRDIRRFLEDNNIDIVIGEPTNLNELMTCIICRELKIKFIAPADMRYPNGRLIFTEGYLQDKLIPSGLPPESNAGETFLRQFGESRQRPAYFEHHNKQPVTTAGRLYRSARRRIKRRELGKQLNLTHPTVTERGLYMGRRVMNGFYLRHIVSYQALSDIPGRIAFFGLHVQPEASIDVRGSYFSDQIKLVTDIRRALPFDTALVIKEHPNFLGIRGPSFFRQIRRIPNVALVKHDVSTFDILDRCAVVFTVSGTIAYEAGMLGIPAVVFSPVYFDRLSSVHYCGDITALKDLLTRIRDGEDCNPEADGSLMSELIGNSYPGRWSDPFNVPSVMDDTNMAKLEFAFHRIVEHDRR